jgi:hypothetical protein
MINALEVLGFNSIDCLKTDHGRKLNTLQKDQTGHFFHGNNKTSRKTEKPDVADHWEGNEFVALNGQVAYFSEHKIVFIGISQGASGVDKISVRSYAIRKKILQA